MSIKLFLKSVIYFKVLIIFYSIFYSILNNEIKFKQVPKIGFNLGTVPNYLYTVTLCYAGDSNTTDYLENQTSHLF